MNNRPGGGYGICGHKNVYNSSVKEGNWIEDKFGVDLATKCTISKQLVDSEHNSNFKQPSAEFYKYLESTKSAGKSCVELEKTVLFNHGDVFTTDKVSYTAAGKDILRDRANKLKAENDQIACRMSESQAANKHHIDPNFTVRTPPSTTTLPSFARKSTLVRDMIKS
mmetsp:Transcript_28763/g.33951  ORF Transcript_28763/g.33951 Transcript_28763/m.33951 type:complete len:167 (-) Transcript_28763:98-598(-)